MIQQKKYDEVFSGIKKKNWKRLMVEKSNFMKKNYARIWVNTDDDVTLKKPLKFSTLTIIIRCVFPEGEKSYPQIYLDECLYKLQKC